MWQTDIDQQKITVEGTIWHAGRLHELEALNRTETDDALRAVYQFLTEWFAPSPFVNVQTSGSTGTPKQMAVEKSRMINSACLTCDYLKLKPGDTALLCMNLKYIGAKMMVVRALVAGLQLTVRPASGHPMQTLSDPVDFTAIVPLQLYNSLQVEEEKQKLAACKHILVGGGAVNDDLRRQLQPLSARFYSTYGMTETLSHIALQPLNGHEAYARYYPFDGVYLTLSPDQTLIINAPAVCKQPLVTNDVAQIFNDGSFVILGRKDNTVNSGGIKIQIETDEELLRHHLDIPFALTSVPDERLGEALVLLLEQDSAPDSAWLQKQMRNWLPSYHTPRLICQTKKIPVTETGKINRAACKELALQLYNKKQTNTTDHQ